MNRKKWLVIVPIMAAAIAAMLALATGVSSAFAQDDGQSLNSPPPEAGMRGRMGRHLMAGEVVKIEDMTITIKTIRTGEEKAVKVDDQTKYRKDGKDASLADVTTGENVAFLLGPKPDEGTDPVARAVLIGKPDKERLPVIGTISSINGNALTIKTDQGDQQVTLPTLTQGERIAVVKAADGSIRGVMYNPPEKAPGDQNGEDPVPEDQPAA